jgi:4-hydroxybenzoate polyprenyltransferase
VSACHDDGAVAGSGARSGADRLPASRSPTAGTPPAAPHKVSLGQALFDLSRGRQASFSIAGAGLAAVLAAGGLPGWRITCIGLVAAWAGYFVAFSLNDVLDRKIDAEALRVGKQRTAEFDLDTAFIRHPLAAGRLSLGVSLLWVGGLTAVATAGTLLLGPLCFVFFVLGALLDVLYSALSRVTWLKTVVTGVMVGCGGLAGWVAVAPLSKAAIPVFVFLAIWEIGGRNLANDLADLGPDSSVGIRSVATTFGPRAAARANLVMGVAMVASVAWLQMPGWALATALACGAWLVVRPGVLLARDPGSTRAGYYFNHASLYPVAVLLVAAVGLSATWL